VLHNKAMNQTRARSNSGEPAPPAVIIGSALAGYCRRSPD
jgi:hypothetical protein